MKTFALILLNAVGMNSVIAQEPNSKYTTLVYKADSLLQLKDHKKAAKTYSAAFKANGWKGSPRARYNAARAWAMAGKPDSAFFSLDRLVTKLYFAEYELAADEPDFAALHDDARWQPLLNRMRENKPPQGWYRAGSSPYAYQMFTDSGAGNAGKNAASIKSVDARIDGFGTLMQTVSADKYLGKRIRMSGFIKSTDVAKWAGLWLRVDDADYKKSLAFDNMKDGKEDRAVRGSTDWKQYDIVLDVPTNAASMSFGALIDGTGQIWFDNLNFEIVDTTVPTTGKDDSEPMNLNFEK